METSVPRGYMRAFQIIMEAYAEEQCGIQLQDVKVYVADDPETETAGEPSAAS